MKFPITTLRTKLYTALNDISVDGANIKLYDRVPSSANYPYMLFGNFTANEESTKNSNGTNVSGIIEVVDGFIGNTGGRKRGEAIANAILGVINSDNNIDLSPDFKCYITILENVNSLDEITETHYITRQILRFNFIIQEN